MGKSTISVGHYFKFAKSSSKPGRINPSQSPWNPRISTFRGPGGLVFLHPLHFRSLCFHRKVRVDHPDSTWPKRRLGAAIELTILKNHGVKVTWDDIWCSKPPTIFWMCWHLFYHILPCCAGMKPIYELLCLPGYWGFDLQLLVPKPGITGVKINDQNGFVGVHWTHLA